MPQLNPEFFISQLFWLTIFFTFLLVFLWKVSLPRIATVIEKRQNKIDENLSSAKELQEEAHEIEKRINDRLNVAKEETNVKIKNTMSSLQEDASSQLNLLDKELEKKISTSEKQILMNRDNQMEKINEEIVKITKITVSKLTDINLSDSEVEKEINSRKEALN